MNMHQLLCSFRYQTYNFSAFPLPFFLSVPSVPSVANLASSLGLCFVFRNEGRTEGRMLFCNFPLIKAPTCTLGRGNQQLTIFHDAGNNIRGYAKEMLVAVKPPRE